MNFLLFLMESGLAGGLVYKATGNPFLGLAALMALFAIRAAIREFK